MDQPQIDQPASQPQRSFTWYKTWTRAVTRPYVQTYEEILSDPKASPNRGYLWVFLASILGGIVTAILMATNLQENPNLFGEFPVILFSLCCLPLTSILSVLGLIINTAVTQLIARLLGGLGSYSQLVYVFAAITAPMAVVSAALGLIGSVVPVLGFGISFLISLYAIVLQVTAVKAVNRFSWGRAVLTFVILFVIVMIIAAVIAGVVAAILLASGAAVGDVFNNIMQNNNMPLP